MASFTREPLSLPGATSGVWTHFGFPAKDGTFLETDNKKRSHVHYRICDKKVKYCGNTTNLRVHLRSSLDLFSSAKARRT